MSKGLLAAALAVAVGATGCTSDPCGKYGMRSITLEQADAVVGRDALRRAFVRAPLIDPVIPVRDTDANVRVVIFRPEYNLSGNYVGVLDLNLKNALKCEQF